MIHKQTKEQKKTVVFKYKHHFFPSYKDDTSYFTYVLIYKEVQYSLLYYFGILYAILKRRMKLIIISGKYFNDLYKYHTKTKIENRILKILNDNNSAILSQGPAFYMLK